MAAHDSGNALTYSVYADGPGFLPIVALNLRHRRRVCPVNTTDGFVVNRTQRGITNWDWVRSPKILQDVSGLAGHFITSVHYCELLRV
jgi:hypothetical protein